MLKGTKYRMAIKLVNLGIKLRIVWLIDFGNELKKEALGDFI